jgi:hypothetical protein
LKLNLAPIVVTGIANSPWIPTDSRLATPTVGLNVILSAGGAQTYSVQTTQDDPYGAAGIVNFTAAPTLTPALSATASAQYTITGQFVTAVRVVVSASTGTVTVNAWQSDNNLGA